MPEKITLETVKVTMAPEKRRAETVKVAVAQSKGGFKRPSDMDIASMKSMKLSKNIVPHAIASTATVCITLEAPSLKNLEL
jgi:hypothetical protein